MEPKTILGVLADALAAPNPYYNPAIEVARLDAAEVILTHTESDDDENIAAKAMLLEIAFGSDAKATVVSRVRACKLLLSVGITS